MTALLIMHSEAAAAAGDDDGAGVDHFVRVWMNQLRELAYDADDCIDLYKLRIKSRPTDGVLLRLKRLFGTLLARRRLAGEIAALRSRAVAIGERHARFGGGVDRDALRRRRPSSSSSTSAPPPPARALHDVPQHRHHLVGIEDQAEAMARKLVVKDEGGEISRRAMVLSIVGFGGLGKTTLAKEVCRRLEEEFPYQAMVSVSQAFEAGRDLEELCKRRRMQEEPKMMVRRHCWQQMLVSRTTTKIRL
ncbi:hypothetical protein HU200_043415 [Digitaria exilis]|uniref:Uncharacterized protein n=1 Tax=Digitaria exilis TaxID=1010633 RepID=A0A835B0P7_9POAL|nr:hypothetical protein HU200_043415 [Digitaria exilis]